MASPSSAPPAPAHPRLDELVATLHRLRAPAAAPGIATRPTSRSCSTSSRRCYELIEAIEGGTREELIEELGDVLYQVIFHADIEAEAGSFTLEDVAAHMTAEDDRAAPARVRRCRRRDAG